MTKRAARLRALPQVTSLPDETVERAVEDADEASVRAGCVLVDDGDWGDEVIVVCDGRATVIVDGRAEGSLGPGAVIGAAPPLGPPAPSTTIVAVTPMRFFLFERTTFAALDATGRGPDPLV
jgi:CRP-like cAMP-binding protein